MVRSSKGLSRDKLMGRHSEEVTVSRAFRKKKHLEKELQNHLEKVSQGRGRKDKSLRLA